MAERQATATGPQVATVDGVKMVRIGNTIMDRETAERNVTNLRRRVSALNDAKATIDGDALLAKAQSDLDSHIARLTERRAKLNKAEIIAAAEQRIDGYMAAASKAADDLDALVGKLD